ncbi:MAG: ABC transporter permease [Methylobacteriaceae bacterium]|nr:ABC transporter permease [Methylobacteriaceae bacterium]
MLPYLARRLVSALPIVAILAIATFIFLRLSGDPTAELAGENATAERIEALRRSLGLDRSVATQFGLWLGHLLQGDLGTSLITRQPVAAMISERLEATLSLALTTTVTSVLLAVPLGVLAARFKGGLLDRAITLFCVGGFSMPTFVAGYLLVWLFSIRLGWLPAQGYISMLVDPAEWLLHLVAPTLAMSTVFIVLIARITRASVIEVLGQDFVRTARALGATEVRVFTLYALRNAAVPIVTIIAVGIGIVLTGVVVTETVFNLPGIGRLTIEAVLARDYPVIQAVILLFSLTYVVINLAIDVAYAALDPRIRS